MENEDCEIRVFFLLTSLIKKHLLQFYRINPPQTSLPSQLWLAKDPIYTTNFFLWEVPRTQVERMMGLDDLTRSEQILLPESFKEWLWGKRVMDPFWEIVFSIRQRTKHYVQL